MIPEAGLFKSFFTILFQPYTLLFRTFASLYTAKKRRVRDEWNCHVQVSTHSFAAQQQHKLTKRKKQQFKQYKLGRTTLVFLFFTDIPGILKTAESKVIGVTKKATLDYRSAQMEQFSMTGVAGALVAQVASSSLQLEYMKTINPIVPALCTSSLVIALFCVLYSFEIHLSFARRTCAEDLITAFTQRAPDGIGGGSGEGGPRSREGREGCVVREGEEEVQESGGGDEGGEDAGARDRQLEEGTPGPMEDEGKKEPAEGGEKSVAEEGEKSIAEKGEKRGRKGSYPIRLR